MKLAFRVNDRRASNVAFVAISMKAEAVDVAVTSLYYTLQFFIIFAILRSMQSWESADSCAELKPSDDGSGGGR